MSNNDKDREGMSDELKWVKLRDENSDFIENIKSKGVSGFLVPIGCITTVGVLLSGLNNMFKRNSQKQQKLMRYRVLAQGVTILIASFGILSFKT